MSNSVVMGEDAPFVHPAKSALIDTHNTVGHALHHLKIMAGKKYRQSIFTRELLKDRRYCAGTFHPPRTAGRPKSWSSVSPSARAQSILVLSVRRIMKKTACLGPGRAGTRRASINDVAFFFRIADFL